MIIIDEKLLDPIIQTIKNLPVRGDFKAADAWVGCVIELERIRATAQKFKPQENENGR